MRNLQYQLANGAWANCNSELFGDRREKFLSRCESNNAMTREEVIAALESGEILRNDPADWYSNCRYEPAPVERVEPKMVHCDCGHSTPLGTVMSASMGTACPNCYDRMSD